MDDEPQPQPISQVDVNRLVEDELAWQAERIDTGEVPPLQDLTPAGVDAVKRRWRIPGRLTERKIRLAMLREHRMRAPRRVLLPRTSRARAPRRRLRARTGSSTSRGDPPPSDDDPEPPRRPLLRLAAAWIFLAGLIDVVGCLLWRWLR